MPNAILQNRSDGGAISVTRSRTSLFLDSGAKVITLSSSREVQAYLILLSTSMLHSLHALALMHEKRMARLGSRCARIQRSPSSTDCPGSNGTSKMSHRP